jgi:uncharacterized membrane protein HdeD (DUF308 family)
VVDEITDNDDIIEIAERYKVSKKNFVTAINLFSSVLSFGFGFYSLSWCNHHGESVFEYANSVITIINGIVNLIQSVVRFKYDDTKFDEVNKWSIFCEVVVQIIIMVVIGRQKSQEDQTARYYTIVVALDALLDSIADMHE